MAWKRLIREYFTFNKRERRGLYVLLVLLTVLSVAHAIVKFAPVEAEELSAAEKMKIEAMVVALTPKADPVPVEAVSADSSPEPVTWTSFDPNTVSFDTLRQTGLDSTLAARLIKYRERGGRFRNSDDLAKLYDMDTGWLDEARTYLRFEPDGTGSAIARTYTAERDTIQASRPKPRIRVELNLADSTQLRDIPGIGAYYAREIVALRNSLHGFRSYEQLLDIYNMRDRALENLIKHTTLDTALCSCINVNTCDLETLGRHPYLTWKQARIIIAYRQQHGAFRSVRDILRTDVVPDSVYRQVAPYLCVD